MSNAAAAFALTLDQLAEQRDLLSQRIHKGLDAPGGQIKALFAYAEAPEPGLSGDALVVDTGGTNARAAWVRLGETPEVLAGPTEARLEVRGEREMSAADFFSVQTGLVDALDPAPPKGLPIGYCFSYPSEVLPSRDARLLRWTKGIQIPGVEGEIVGAPLKAALAAHEPGEVSVLNDTVAAMLAGSMIHPDPQQVMGLIGGTGSNLAIYATQGARLSAAGLSGAQAINLESGNFHPPHLNAFDEAIDEASPTPGEQRFEKAVGGFYLPQLYTLANPYDPIDPAEGAGALSARIESGAPGAALAQAILHRSADMVAVLLAAGATNYPVDSEVAVLAEGSLFWRSPGFRERVETRFAELATEGRRLKVLRLKHANLIGSACAALSR